eukprot:875360-Rhodomonas_salina.1
MRLSSTPSDLERSSVTSPVNLPSLYQPSVSGSQRRSIPSHRNCALANKRSQNLQKRIKRNQTHCSKALNPVSARPFLVWSNAACSFLMWSNAARSLLVWSNTARSLLMRSNAVRSTTAVEMTSDLQSFPSFSLSLPASRPPDLPASLPPSLPPSLPLSLRPSVPPLSVHPSFFFHILALQLTCLCP